MQAGFFEEHLKSASVLTSLTRAASPNVFNDSSFSQPSSIIVVVFEPFERLGPVTTGV
jgi:hypothetical protein